MITLILAIITCLVPADSPTPASGYCPEMSGNTVTIVENTDVPTPRCATVTDSQHLRVVNHMNHPITLVWRPFVNRTIPVGGSTTYSRQFGQYLAKGDHVIRLAHRDGAGEIYLPKPIDKPSSVG